MQTAAADPQVATRLDAFRRQLRRLHDRRAARWGALRTAGLAFGPALVVAWWWPQLRLAVPVTFLAVVAIGALAACASQRRRLATAWLAGVQAPPRGLSDAFATWLEVGERHDAMTAWLAHDLDARITSLQAPQLVGVGRRRVIGRRWFALALLLLLLALLLAWWLDPRWPGLFSGRPQPPPPPPPAPAAALGSTSPTPDATQPRPEPEPQPVAGEPEPPLDLPEDRQFVVPKFTDDGPTRQERVRVAELPRPAGASPTSASGATGAVPPPTPEEFARAAEAAQRARHVAPHEQPIVRRYFELLQAAGREARK